MKRHVWESAGGWAEPGACRPASCIKGRLGDGWGGRELKRASQETQQRWKQAAKRLAKQPGASSQEVRVYRDCHLQNLAAFISGEEFELKNGSASVFP